MAAHNRLQVLNSSFIDLFLARAIISLAVLSLLLSISLASVRKRCVEISGVRPTEVTQTWGTVRCGESASGLAVTVRGQTFSQVIGTHAESEISFDNPGKARLRFSAGLPDYLVPDRGSVVFRVMGDGDLIWQSPVVKPGMLIEADVDISGRKKFSLMVGDAGNGNYWDHACWIDPELR